jgi:hypothetical protein
MLNLIALRIGNLPISELKGIVHTDRIPPRYKTYPTLAGHCAIMYT